MGWKKRSRGARLLASHVLWTTTRHTRPTRVYAQASPANKKRQLEAAARNRGEEKCTRSRHFQPLAGNGSRKVSPRLERDASATVRDYYGKQKKNEYATRLSSIREQKYVYTTRRSPPHKWFLAGCSSLPSRDSPNISRRFAPFGADDVCLVGENPTRSSVPA